MTAEHEAKCKRCGRCCQLKAIFEGEVYLMPGFCRFWDPMTRLCTVYERRHHVNPDGCRTIARAIYEGGLPMDCPYVADRPGYQTKVVEWKL